VSLLPNFLCPSCLWFLQYSSPLSGVISIRKIVFPHISTRAALPRWLTAGNLSVQLNLNDYLDIYCPSYPESGSLVPEQPETLVLYLVEEEAFKGCVETKKAVKRWECNTPFAPFGPVRFSEKIQRFTPFSLGFEFLPGRHYNYSSLPTDEGPPLPCMKMRVTICCEPINSSELPIPVGNVAQSLWESLYGGGPFFFLLLLLRFVCASLWAF
uniref:Ephrin RBD domain-containing protein n=1 Tax=Poecilia formosa TaxID=48698 RepID=A0A096M9B1_POEFO